MASAPLRLLVTGAASGIGRAIVHAARVAGHAVLAVDRDGPGLEALPGVERRVVDLSDGAAVDRLAAEAGPIDVLVNAAGVALFRSAEEADPDAVEHLFAVNVLAPARLTRGLLPTLRARRGIVVNISSIAGRLTFPESGFYAATKHALEALSEALALEAGPLGVRVRVVQPGAIDSALQAGAVALGGERTDASDYAALHAEWDRRRTAILAEPPQPPELVAEAVLASLQGDAVLLRVPVGTDAARILSAGEGTALDAVEAGERL
jgi:NAD(P)-dependent dehydrogenase (short-subunit alcohol dehydrogenase family)